MVKLKKKLTSWVCPGVIIIHKQGQICASSIWSWLHEVTISCSSLKYWLVQVKHRQRLTVNHPLAVYIKHAVYCWYGSSALRVKLNRVKTWRNRWHINIQLQDTLCVNASSRGWDRVMQTLDHGLRLWGVISKWIFFQWPIPLKLAYCGIHIDVEILI